MLAAYQEVRTCPFTSASVLAIACPSLVAAAGATLTASVTATGLMESDCLRLRAKAAAAPAAEAGSGSMLSEMALAGMAGRAMAGTVGTGVGRS